MDKDTEYEIEHDEGYIHAYVIENNEEGISSLFGKGSENPLINLLNLDINTFIYLEEIYIYTEFRRQGYATEFLKNFLLLVEDEDIPIILLAGSDQTPKSMDIVYFYEDFGFEILFDDGERKVMIR